MSWERTSAISTFRRPQPFCLSSASPHTTFKVVASSASFLARAASFHLSLLHIFFLRHIMSLPSRPNRPVVGGLPSGPRRPSAAARTNDRPSEPSSSARVVRPQRSLAQLPTRVQPNDEDYDTLPSAPRSRTRSTAGRDERSAGRERPPMPSQRDSGYGSASSTSGSGSAGTSFLDRMRVRSSDTTPRTSIDEDRATERKPARSRRRDYEEEDEYDDDDRRERRRGMSGLRAVRYSHADPGVVDHRKSVAAQAAAQGDGSWIWSTVAAAAGNLTLNINKAWTTKVAIYSGEG
jgi:hypothetical protein